MRNQKQQVRRTFVIGDIHGCWTELCQLMARFKEQFDLDLNEDRLILLGDYIDRGSQSAKVILWLIELLEQYGSEHVIPLMGNHEHMALDYFNEQNKERWMRNGAKETLESFELAQGTLEKFLSFSKELKLYFEDDNYLYVHAGIRPSMPLTEQTTRDLVWIREEFYKVTQAYHKPVIFGHTPVMSISGGYQPVEINGNIALDTSCVYGGYLSGLMIEPSGKRHVVQSDQNPDAFLET